jgi:NTE family protein
MQLFPAFGGIDGNFFNSCTMKEDLSMSEYICCRRRFLGLMTASLPGVSLFEGSGTAMAGETVEQDRSEGSKPEQPSIGIALGAGGANGLAHILMLEALDDMGIRGLVERFVLSDQDESLSRLFDRGALEWINFVDIELGNGGLVSADGFLAFMSETLKKKSH